MSSVHFNFIDFGVDELIQFKKQTKFPWLLSNVADDLTDDLLAEGVEKLMLDWHGRKVCLNDVTSPRTWHILISN